MEYIKIKDLDVQISDGNYSSKYPNSSEFISSGIPFIRCNNFFNNSITNKDMYYISKEKHSELLKGHLKTNDVLISTRGNIGQVVIVPEKYNDANINAQIVLLRPGKTLDCRYLMWSLKSGYVQKQMEQNQTGSALKQLPVKRLSEIKVPIEMDINIQKNIADKLDKIFTMINLKKEEMKKIDELIKSQFVEMFGNIKTNDKKWNVYSNLLNYCVFNPKKNEIAEVNKDTMVTFLPMQNVSVDGVINYSIEKKISEVWKGFTYFKENDVLFAKITPCMENGKGAVAKKLKNGIGFGTTEFHVIRPNKEINSVWLYHVLADKDFRKEAGENMTGSAGQKRVPITFLENYKLAIPPIELQNKFAQIVEQIDKQKFEFENSLKKLEELQASLMQEYFG